MAANPADTGAAGLATESVGVSAGGTKDQLDDVRSIFTTLEMAITERDFIIIAHNFTNMDDFDYIRVNDSGSFVKVWNETLQSVAAKVDIPKQGKLQGFLYWYHDQRNRALILVAADFDATAMRLAVNEVDAEKSGK